MNRHFILITILRRYMLGQPMCRTEGVTVKDGPANMTNEVTKGAIHKVRTLFFQEI